MSNSRRLPPDSPPGPPARPWRATAAMAALAAIVMAVLHSNALISAAGLAAAGVSVTALAEAVLRPLRGNPSRLAVSLVAMLTFAAAVLCLLGLAAGGRLR